MSPDPPAEPEESPIRCQTNLNYGQQTSDESEDEEFQMGLDGYQPLNMNPEVETMDDENDDDEEEENESDNNEAEGVIEQNSDPEPDLGLQMVVEEVWNQPRPQELNFDLDASKQELIKSKMQQFQLPKLESAPAWMQNCSDEELVSRALSVIQQKSQQQQQQQQQQQ